MWQQAVGIALARWLDLDDVGAEIRQHRGRRWCSDKARAVQHLQPFENAFFFHRGVAPTALVVGGQNTAATLLRAPFEPCWGDDATPGRVMGRCASGPSASYSPPASNAALPPAAAVLTVTVCSVAKRAR